MTRRRNIRFSRGFTLIELMLAIMILGLVLAMLASSFNVVAHGKVQAENRLDMDHEGRSILWMIGNEITGAVQTPIVASRVLLIGQGHMSNGKPLDSLTISTLDLSHSPSLDGFGAERLVSYSTVINPQNRQFSMLMRGEQSALLTALTTGNPIPIAGNLISLHFRYFDGANWQESWDSSSLPPGRQLPGAVSIDLTIADDQGRQLGFSTQVTLPMAYLQW
ncbi:MAG: prepilin-type N-terminal cleavage/methylation domain-containing protein [Candidatus Binataceae bacterium]|nr:prepilin-type N-terminal cleavage/methylation domain-containing protein [Candidatus Binataceae bacterium]